MCAEGRIQAVYRKHFLPNYGVFDEHRYFAEGRDLVVLQLGEASVGITICEDVWQPGPPETDLALAGAQLIVNLSASPFHVGKAEEREEMLVTRARDTSSYFAFCNLVGGQDELVFDGHSVVLDDSGAVIARAPGFEEHLLVVDLEPTDVIGRRFVTCGDGSSIAHASTLPASRSSSSIHHASRRTRSQDRSRRSHRSSTRCVGRSRSASATTSRRTASRRSWSAVSGESTRQSRRRSCVDALGPDRVHCVSMPSRYSSEGTRTDARAVAESLGCAFREISIESTVGAFHDALASEIDGGLVGLAAENLQARVRGVLLMALSNTYGWLVVSTGNKSELAVGYSTLYGDMVGGFALLKDVFKTDVYRLAEHLNARAGRDVIPRTTIERAPSAELRDDQRDSDSLPPYDVLDPVLEAYVEEDRSREELQDEFDAAVVERVVALVDRAEYKRRQAPPGVKLRAKAFGRDRRTPITNRFRG